MQPQSLSPEHLLALAPQVLDIEGEALRALSTRLDAGFADAVALILACTGRVVVSGMGKSGHVGSKIAATLASTGTPPSSCTRAKQPRRPRHDRTQRCCAGLVEFGREQRNCQHRAADQARGAKLLR